MEIKKKVKLIAFYLPQFHPIPENDKWWGRGFTEWTNVANAKALFPNHYQPHIPADLGFYDLRVPETRIAQAYMAEEYGIEAFCYWHYWFAGKRLLERPFNEVLEAKVPNISFCLGWANNNWTGIWHGNADRMLMEQTYPGKNDEQAHFYCVFKAFSDKRYLKVDDKPLFYIYKPHELPEPNRFTDHWRELALKEGLKGIYFVGETNKTNWNPREDGFDASAPHMGQVFIKLMARHLSFTQLLKSKIMNNFYGVNNIFLYDDFVRLATYELRHEFDEYPCVMPNWDNSPRCGKNAYILLNSTPETFRIHLKKAIQQVTLRKFDKSLIFVKSWNEWAEGNYLEPDSRFGRKYLEVCREEVFL